MLLTEKDSKSICDKLLGYTKADDAEVSVTSEDFSHLRFAANGFTTSGRRENAIASVTARTPDGASSGFFLRNHFDVAKLDTARIAREAIRKALDSKNPHTLEPGVYPVILEAQAADDLIRFNFDARSADEGRSPYSAPGGKTKLGQRI